MRQGNYIFELADGTERRSVSYRTRYGSRASADLDGGTDAIFCAKLENFSTESLA